MPTTPRTAPHLFTCPPMECRNHQYLDQPSTASNTMAATATHRTTSPTGKTTGASLYAPVPPPCLSTTHITYHTWQTDHKQQMAQPGPARSGTRHTTSPAVPSTHFLCLAHSFSFRPLFPHHLIKRPATSRGMAWHNTATANQAKSSQGKCHVSVFLVSAVLTYSLTCTHARLLWIPGIRQGARHNAKTNIGIGI
jgi:hypothetical protein